MKKLSLLVLLASLMALVAAAPVFADNHGDHKDAHGEEHKDGEHKEEKH